DGLAPPAARAPIARVVRKHHRLVGRAEGQADEHWTEDLLAGHRGSRLHARDESRWEEAAAGWQRFPFRVLRLEHRRAFGRARRHELANALELHRRHDGTHIDRLVEGMADPQATHAPLRSEEHTSELQSLTNLVCRLLLEKKKNIKKTTTTKSNDETCELT